MRVKKLCREIYTVFCLINKCIVMRDKKFIDFMVPLL